ncbi:WxL domain-containing protein [Enterococcus sp. LJL90]
MKYRKAVSFVLIGALSVGLAVPVSASSLGSTAGDITFAENTDPTDPVDPTDPSLPDPGDNSEDNKETGNKGPLSLDVVPRQFDFGTQKISSFIQTYNNQPKSVNKYNYLQVTDNRIDVNGWSVSVKAAPFTDGGTNVLEGATLILPSGTPRNSNTGPAEVDNISTRGGTLTTDGSDKNGAASLTVFGVAAAENLGKATSVNTWNAQDVKLSVPAGTARKLAYTSTITWTLTANVYS